MSQTDPSDDKQDQPAVPPHNVIERERMPDGQAPHRGEQPGKRTNDERIEPDMQPGSAEGMPHPPRGQ
jgi:hypothetical protein